MAVTAPLGAATQPKQRFIRLCYRLQENRLVQVRLLADLRAVCHSYNLPAASIGLPPFPLYRFVRTRGVLRMVPLPGMAGGANVPNLRVSTDTVPDAAILRVEGELDLATAPMLSSAIMDAYRTNVRLIVDLSRLDYLDIAGVHVLERAAVRHHGRFVVVGSKPMVHRVLEILGLIEALPVKDSIPIARDYLRLQ